MNTYHSPSGKHLSQVLSRSTCGPCCTHRVLSWDCSMSPSSILVPTTFKTRNRFPRVRENNFAFVGEREGGGKRVLLGRESDEIGMQEIERARISLSSSNLWSENILDWWKCIQEPNWTNWKPVKTSRTWSEMRLQRGCSRPLLVLRWMNLLAGPTYTCKIHQIHYLSGCSNTSI